MTLRQAVVPLLVLVCLFGIGKELIDPTPPVFPALGGLQPTDLRADLCPAALAAVKGAQKDGRCTGVVPSYDTNTVEVFVVTPLGVGKTAVDQQNIYAVMFQYDRGQFTRRQVKLELAAEPAPRRK